MVDLLIEDLNKQVQTETVEENEAQAEYELFMKDSAIKRSDDAKLITEKDGVLAETKATLVANQKELKSTQGEAMANDKHLFALHQDCDWLLKNYVYRKEARKAEIDSLERAKAVLSGADYTL